MNHAGVVHDETHHITPDFDQRVIVAKREHAAPAQPENRFCELRAEPLGSRLHLDFTLRREQKFLHSPCVLC